MKKSLTLLLVATLICPPSFAAQTQGTNQQVKNIAQEKSLLSNITISSEDISKELADIIRFRSVVARYAQGTLNVPSLYSQLSNRDMGIEVIALTLTALFNGKKRFLPFAAGTAYLGKRVFDIKNDPSSVQNIVEQIKQKTPGELREFLKEADLRIQELISLKNTIGERERITLEELENKQLATMSSKEAREKLDEITQERNELIRFRDVANKYLTGEIKFKDVTTTSLAFFASLVLLTISARGLGLARTHEDGVIFLGGILASGVMAAATGTETFNQIKGENSQQLVLRGVIDKLENMTPEEQAYFLKGVDTAIDELQKKQDKLRNILDIDSGSQQKALP